MRSLVQSAVVGVLCFTGALGAQSSVVRVRVVDSTGVPIAEAEVAATRGMSVTVSSATTNENGVAALSVPRGSGEYQVTARRIGYQRGDRFFRAERDSIDVVITLLGAAQLLPSVQITSPVDLRRKRFHLSAEDISASTRPILDGLDAVTKLRPDMINPPGQGIETRCGLSFLWVNGRRVIYPPIDPALAMRARTARRAAQIGVRGGLEVQGQARIPLSVQSALATIRPEHIAELNYADCSDTTVTRASARGALFVALKPGVGFEPGLGSFVVDTSEAEPPDADEPKLPAFRIRVLGVYDDVTGLPIAGAQVMDDATGTYATSTVTGTVSLAFLPVGTSAVRVRMSGYVELKLDVTISPLQVDPITTVLKRP